jgi:hypothetical protein
VPYASTPETRKAIEPNTSGAHTSLFSWLVERPVCIALNVLTLKSTVPTNWIAALHHDAPANRRWARSVPSRSSAAAAEVKKIEPAKKTAASVPSPTSWTKPGNGPTKKHTEPIAKPAAIQRSQSTVASGRRTGASAWLITAQAGAGAGSGSSSKRVVGSLRVAQKAAISMKPANSSAVLSAWS